MRCPCGFETSKYQSLSPGKIIKTSVQSKSSGDSLTSLVQKDMCKCARVRPLDPDVSAIDELLSLIVAHRLTGVAAWFTREPAMICAAAPTSRRNLVPIATIVNCWHTTVGSPPTPLQGTLCALEACRDAVAELVSLATALGRQIETLRMPRVHRLAVRSGVIGLAICWRCHPLQDPPAQASRGICCGAVDPTITDAHLNVSEVVRCNHMFELDDLASSVGCLNSRETIEKRRSSAHSIRCV